MKMDEFAVNEEEEDIYSTEFISELVEDDEITAEEAAFMFGYSGS